MSAPVFRLKGGGWYETDFKGDQDNKRNLADRPEAEAPKDLPKEAAASGTDAKSTDGGGKDAKADTAAKDTPKETPKAKPSETARTDSPKKSDARKMPRMHTPGRGKSAGKRPIKRPVHKAKRRV
jgi:hypothetical protein